MRGLSLIIQLVYLILTNSSVLSQLSFLMISENNPDDEFSLMVYRASVRVSTLYAKSLVVNTSLRLEKFSHSFRYLRAISISSLGFFISLKHLFSSSFLPSWLLRAIYSPSVNLRQNGLCSQLLPLLFNCWLILVLSKLSAYRLQKLSQ